MLIRDLCVRSKYAGHRSALPVAVLVLAGCASTHAGARAGQDDGDGNAALRLAEPPMVIDATSIDPGIPTPESVAGHVMGDGAIRHGPLTRYLHALADASPLVTLTPYAESHEGRALYYLTITSEANHARLDEIKALNSELSDPRRHDTPARGDQLIDELPGIAWMAYAIHGDELSSTDAAVQLAYQLAAGTDATTKRMRDELVIHIDPLMNPDGRERYLAQLQTLSGKVLNPDIQAMQHSGLWSAGRGNHYLFDLNRDWLMQVHPETRGRAEVIRSWNPHLVVDSHEMGGLDTYLFDPPREPWNTQIPQHNIDWRRRFSADQAKSFDKHGWSYYTREWYEEWYPGYTNSWCNLRGSVGLLYEQARVNAAALTQASGKVLTYREAVHHHFVSSIANLTTLMENKSAMLRDFLADRRRAVTVEDSDDATFLVAPPADRSLLRRFVELLNGHGIEFAMTAEPLEALDLRDVWGADIERKHFEAGTLVIRSRQPLQRLLRALLEFDPHMSDAFLKDERTDLENHRGTRVYDITAWNVAMAYGLDAYWARQMPTVATGPFTPHKTVFDGLRSGYGYLIDGKDGDVYTAVARLLDRDCKLRAALKDFTIGGRAFRPGTILLRNHENPADVAKRLVRAQSGLTIDIIAVDGALAESGPDLGGQRFRLLTAPRVAIASQWPTSTTTFGSIWHLLDVRIGVRSSPVNVQSLGGVDLRKYNVLILPHAWSQSGLRAVFNEKVRKRLKTWVEAGGTLIAMGSTAAFLADAKLGMSQVRRKRDVLDKSGVFAEALKREKSAAGVEVDPKSVWGNETTPQDSQKPKDSQETSTKKTPEAGKGKADADALKRADSFARLFSPGGAITAARLNPEHWLCFGLGSRLPVLLSGSYALMSKYPVATPARLGAEDAIRLSGLMWPEARKRWADTAYATVERLGAGQVVLFATEPLFRGYFEGSGRLLLNAVIMGPGMGTSQPIPW